MDAVEFEYLHGRVIDSGYGREVLWQQNLKPCEDSEEFFGQYVWVVLSSGMKNQIARQIEKKVDAALKAGVSVSTVFGHPGKAAAIDMMRAKHAVFFSLYQAAEDKVAYLGTLPWIGGITKWHLAKNLGLDVVKPDRHLVRIAAKYDMTPDEMCRKLAEVTPWKAATIDYVIWRAANLGLV